MTPKTIYRPGQKLGRYEFIKPADHNSVSARAGCDLAFYLFDHCFSFSKLIYVAAHDSIVKSRRCRFHKQLTTPHYKTVTHRLPEKPQFLNCRSPARKVIVELTLAVARG
jgi:hypothetical protein